MKTHLFVYGFMLCSIVCTNLLGLNNIEKKLIQETRTVSYDEKSLESEGLFSELDEHFITTNDYGFEAVGIKKYDKSIFEGVNYCGLDPLQDLKVKYDVIYLENENTILLSILIDADEEIPIIKSIPGLISINNAGEQDVIFAYEGEYLWLSDIVGNDVLNEDGFLTWLFNKIAEAIVTAFEGRLLFYINGFKFVKDIITLNFDKAGADFGAMFLNMYEGVDSNGKLTGVYHANFDCWQQYFGYTNLYDNVFKAFTTMDRRRFEFKVDTNSDGVKDQDYILWAWKGDYLNLGVGAELGVYKKWIFDTNFWTVDKKASMKMTLNLDLKINNETRNVFYWSPTEYQWWITGFNYKYHITLNEISNLKATYEVNFVTKSYSSAFDRNFMNSFMEENKNKSWGWNQTTKFKTFKFSF